MFSFYNIIIYKNIVHIFSLSTSYGKDVENILAFLEENTDPDCVALIMEFLHSLVKLKLAALTPLYPACIKSAVTWVPVEQVRNLLLLDLLVMHQFEIYNPR